MKQRIILAVILLILLFSFVNLSFAENKITIVVSGQAHSSLYPCTCPKNPAGGLSRRATVINEIRSKEPNILLLESGGSFAGGRYDVNSQAADLDKQRTKFYMQALLKMRYDAFLVSSEELNFGEDFLKGVISQYPLNYLSANFKKNTKPYIIKEISGIKIAVIGITDPEAKDKTKTQYIKPEEPLISAIKKIKDNKEADLIIVLSYLSQEEASALLNKVDGIDILISSGNPFKLSSFHEINGTILVQPAWETRKLTKIDLDFSNFKRGSDIQLVLDDMEEKTDVENLIFTKIENINLGDDLKDDSQMLSVIPACFKDADCVKPGYISKCNNAATKESKCSFSEIKTVKVTIIEPTGCNTCDIDSAITKINKILPNTELEYLDEADPLAKSIIEESKIKMLPVYLIEQSQIDEEISSRINQIATKSGKYYVLNQSFTGVSYFVNRVKITNRLYLFFDISTPDIVEILDVLRTLRNKNPNIDIKLNFLAIEDKDEGIISKNGRQEIEEFLRSSCVNKYYSDKLLYYIACRISNIESSWWDDCAVKFDIDVSKIKNCAQTQEGTNLLKDFIKLTQELEIVFGPTFLINNQEVLSSQGVPSVEELEKLFE